VGKLKDRYGIRQFIGIGTMVAALLGLASGAKAELRFDLKQTDAGGPFVLISGDFAYSDSLEEFSRLVRENHPLVVTFNSPGGNIFKAIELGRLIRLSTPERNCIGFPEQ
jgi:hypothetical protein